MENIKEQDLFESNSPDSLGVTPRYVLQHNAISRSAHAFSATARKIAAMAMALLPSDLSNLSVAFTYNDFCAALGCEKGGKSFNLFKAAVIECMESTIKVETPPDKKGKTSWELFHWFQYAKFNKDTGICTMVFDEKLAGFLLELKRLYSKINLRDLGSLQSRYALRIYEMAISYSSLMGKDGNEQNTWYMERTIAEMRQIFGLQAEEYKETIDFSKNVIAVPVKEINNAGIGIEIQAEKIKKGRSLTGIRFNCKNTPRTAAKKGRKKKESPMLFPDMNPKTADLRQEKELEHLKELYPDEFATLYEEELAKYPPSIPEGFKQIAAEGSALAMLKECHGIVK
jgi:plasmid replication initiation protein